jgi:hypothetical protein
MNSARRIALGMLTLVCVLAIAFPATAADPASASYALPRSVLGGGGGTSASASSGVTALIGQPAPLGLTATDAYRLETGFYAGLALAPPSYPLTLPLPVNGTVTAAGLTCAGETCSGSYPSGTPVTLTAAPSLGYKVSAWTGCQGVNADQTQCTVTLDQARAVSVSFTPATFPLTVTFAGLGTGTVTSSPSVLTCNATCSAEVPAQQGVTLTAAATGFAAFTGWSGEGCSGTGTCTVTLSQARAVTATFTVPSVALTAQVGGTAAGTVTSTPAGLTCNPTCTASFPQGSSVTLTASPASGATVVGWQNCPSGSGSTCTVTLTAPLTVTALFAPVEAAPPGELPVDAHTLSLYHFNDPPGEQVGDSGPLGNHATAVNTAVAPGRLGDARLLDGQGTGSLTAPHQAAFAVLPQLTLEAWVRPTGFDLACGASTETVVGTGTTVDGQFTGYALTIERTQDAPCGSATTFQSVRYHFTLGRPGAYQTATATSRWHPAHAWTSLAGTYDGTYARLYVNGLLEGTSLPTVGVAQTSGPLTIGHHTWTTGGLPGSSQRLAGRVDEVRLSSIARAAAELLALYRQATTPPGHLEVASTVSAGLSPRALALSPDQTRLLLLGGEPPTVTPLDPATLQPAGESRALLPDAGTALAVTPDGSRLLVTDTPLQALPSSTGAAAPLGPSTPPGQALALHPAGTRAYVSHPTTGTVSVLDLTTDTALPSWDLGPGSQPTSLQLSPDGTRLYVATGPGTLAVLETLTGSLLTTVALASTEATPALAIHPSGETLYLSAGAQVLALDTTTLDGPSAGTLGPLAGPIQSLQVTPDGAFLLATVGGTTPGVLRLALPTGTLRETLSLAGAGSLVLGGSPTAFAHVLQPTAAALTRLQLVPDTPAVLSSPPPGSTLTDVTVTFAWAPVTGALEYGLEVALRPQGTPFFSTSTGTATTATVPFIEPAGQPIHVRLFTRFPDGWQHTTAPYTARRGILPWETPTCGSYLLGPVPLLPRAFWDYVTPYAWTGVVFGCGEW